MQEMKIGQRVLRIVEGDITEMDTDAIVNAANTRLMHGGGVAAAISRRGGPAIQQESNRIGHCPTGGAVLTGGGNLKAKYVIHTVGPRMGEGNEDEKLRRATRSSLELADAEGMRSVTFPAVSAGIYGFPIDRCAAIMLAEAAAYLQGETGLELVVFCLYGKPSYDVFESALKKLEEQKG